MSQPTGFNEERAKAYDDRIRQHIPGYEILHGLSETILAAELPEKASLLIAGAGTGMEILQWAPKHTDWRFTGVDPSEAMIATAREKVTAAAFASRVRLQTGTVDALPEEELFDAAALLLILHFIPDNGAKEELLFAIAGRLKPGAPFLLASLFGDPETTRYKRVITYTKTWAVAHGMDPQKAEELCDPTRKDLFVVPEERIKNLLRYAGFIDVQRVYQALAIGVWFARSPR